MKKFNLLIPIAGKAQRFIDKKYNTPKPLITANNKHIIDWAMQSINYSECNLIFVVRLDHINNFSIDDVLRSKFGDEIKIVVAETETEGSVSSCLLAKNNINNDIPLIIYTPDVYFENKFDPSEIPEDCEGFLLTFKANSPAHSYVQLNENNIAVKTAEKSVISENAAVGFYFFRRGKYFVEFAEKMIESKEKIKNEFYICPLFNYLIKNNLQVKIKQVEKMHVLGTPEELSFFVDKVCKKFGEKPIALCGDHSGHYLKEHTKKILKNLNIEYIDFGPIVNKNCDYSDYVIEASKALNSKTCDFCLSFCRTGQGVNIAANHIEGIIAALVFDEYTAEMSVRHNCANWFSIPQKYVDENQLELIIKTIIVNTFDGGRHMTRIKKFLDINS